MPLQIILLFLIRWQPVSWCLVYLKLSSVLPNFLSRGVSLWNSRVFLTAKLLLTLAVSSTELRTARCLFFMFFAMNVMSAAFLLDLNKDAWLNPAGALLSQSNEDLVNLPSVPLSLTLRWASLVDQ